MINLPPRRVRAAVDALRAARAVLVARRAVAKRPIGDLVARVPASTNRSASTARADVLTPEDERQVARWARAVDRALRWLPGDPACLVRASALRSLLTANGLEAADVRIGVRRGDAGFAAHAWVELRGTPIAEPVALRGAFSSLEGVTLR